MLVILVTGILAGIVLDSWSHLWIWVALAMFTVIGGLMTPIGGSYVRGLREAIGQRPRNAKEAIRTPFR